MAVTIAWGTKIITVTREETAYMTNIQMAPVEVWQLDLNPFRLKLKDLEDDEEGMAHVDTHRHNTEVTLSGLTYARVVEIINGYTVEFEDDQYTVNCTGANHNLADVKVANQVSLIVNNAAGLIGNAQIEYASFNGGVSVDTLNATGRAASGTLFPAGTNQQPCDNLVDALLVASVRGFKKLYLESDLDVDYAADLDGFIIEGNNHVGTTLEIDTSASVDNLKVLNCTIDNTTLDGDVNIENCIIIDVTYVNGFIHDSGLKGTITLGGSRESVLESCFTVDQDNPPTIDMGGSGNDLAMPNYSGMVTITNLTSASEEVGVGLNAGLVTLDSSITAGTIIVAGTGTVIDNSTGSASVNVDGLVNLDAITERVWGYEGP
jgi:hypothetical protein